jgi:hypothetical protein
VIRALVLLCAVGCSSATDVIVSVSANGVNVPVDLDTLRFVVTNPDSDPSGANPVYKSQDLPLCGSGVSKSCYPLPLSLTLYPGSKQPDAPIRVELDALLSGQAVIRDASVFSFLHGQSQRLDFFLSKSCLMTMCAATDLSCDRLGKCVPQEPVSTQPAPSGPVRLVSATAGAVDPTTPGIAAAPSLLPKDLVLVAMWVGGSGDQLTVPRDWQKLGELFQDSHSVLMAHTVTEAEPTSYAFGTQATGTIWHMVVFRGVGKVGGISSRTAPAMIGDIVFPPLYTSAPNAVVVLFAGVGNCAPQAPAELIGNDSVWTVASYPQPVAGDGMATTLRCAPPPFSAPQYEVPLAPE